MSENVFAARTVQHDVAHFEDQTEESTRQAVEACIEAIDTGTAVNAGEYYVNCAVKSFFLPDDQLDYVCDG